MTRDTITDKHKGREFKSNKSKGFSQIQKDTDHSGIDSVAMPDF